MTKINTPRPCDPGDASNGFRKRPSKTPERRKPDRVIEEADRRLLSARFPHWISTQATLSMERSTPSFFSELQEGLARGRRGEVVLLLANDSNQLWLHTKSFYPPGTYRLPTGGIRVGESALDAARREYLEETGLVAPISDCLGEIRFRLERFGEVISFTSYLFLSHIGGKEPAPADAHEKISDFFLISVGQLPLVAEVLRRTPDAWQDWGAFRAIGHEFAALRLAECLGLR